MATSRQPERKILALATGETRSKIRGPLQKNSYKVQYVANPEAARRAVLNDPGIDALFIDLDTCDGGWKGLVDDIRKRDDKLPIFIYGERRTKTLTDEAFDVDVKFYSTSDIGDPVFTSRIETAIRRMDEARARRLSDPTDFLVYGRALNDIINEILELERDSEAKPEDTLQLRREAYDIVDQIYRSIPADARRNQKILLVKEATEGGAIRVNIKLTDNQGKPASLIKRLRNQRVDQVVKDAEYFRKNNPLKDKRHPKMPLEGVLIGLIRDDADEGYLIKEYIVGCDLADLFLAMPAVGEQEALEDFKLGCISVGLERTDYWQKHAPEVTDEKDPQKVIAFYKKNIARPFDLFFRCANTCLHDGQKAYLLKDALQAFRFEGIIAEDTIARNFAATYRNMIAETSTETTPEALLREMMAERPSLEAIAGRIVHVDTHRKYSHVLEDYLEMIDSVTVSLPNQKREELIGRVLSWQEETVRQKVEDALPTIGFYRAMRKIFFALDRFGGSLDELLQRGIIKQDERERMAKQYTDSVGHYLGMASYWLQRRMGQVRAKAESITSPALSRFYTSIKGEGFLSDVLQKPNAGKAIRSIRRLFKRKVNPTDASDEEKAIVRDYIHLRYVEQTVNRMAATYRTIDYSKV